MPPERWPKDAESVARIRAKWDDQVGDARQEIVMIGMYMDEAELLSKFDACLLTYWEMSEGPSTWICWPNPLPGWPDSHRH